MKVLIVLAMAVAVSSAAFSGSLLQQTKPIAKDVFGQLKAEVAVKSFGRRGSNVKFQNEFVNAMEVHVEGVLGELDAALHAHETVSETINDQLAALTKELEELIAAYQANPTNHEEFQAKYAALIQKILALISLNSQSAHSAELLSSLDLTETVFSAVRQTLGDTVADKVIANLQVQSRANARGIIDDIINGIENALDSIGLGNIASEIGNIVNAITNQVKDKLKALKQLAEKLFGMNWEGISALGQQAAQALMDVMAGNYCKLGHLGAQLVSKLLATYTGLTIPPAIIVAVGGKIYEIISGNPSNCD